MNCENKKFSGFSRCAVFFIGLVFLIEGCASLQSFLQNKIKAEEPVDYGSITDIYFSEDAESLHVWINGNRLLNYSSVKQPVPIAVSLYFPQTTLTTDKVVNVPDNKTIAGIIADEIGAKGHASSVEVSLKKEVSYEIKRTDKGLRISFFKESKGSASTDTLTPKPKDKSTQTATHLYSLETKRQEGELHILVKADGEINDYKSFSIERPAKIVIDIFNLTTSLKNEAVFPINDKKVKKIIHYKYHDRIRLILETDGTYLDSFSAHPVAGGLLICADNGEDTPDKIMASEADQAGLARVRRIDFSSKDSGTSSIVIETTRSVRYKITPSEDRRHQLMLFDTRLPLSLTFARYESAVVQISPVLDPTIENAAVFEMEMRKSVPYLIEQSDNLLMIHFEASPKLSRLHEKLKPRLQRKTEFQGRSPIDKEVYLFLNNWKTAWENTAGDSGDIKTYMFHYLEDFTSGGLDKDGWKLDKLKKNRKRGWISGELIDIIAGPVKDNQLEVHFFLDYKSPNYNERLDKTLLLQKEKTGWKIIGEKTRLLSPDERKRLSIKP